MLVPIGHVMHWPALVVELYVSTVQRSQVSLLFEFKKDPDGQTERHFRR